MPIVAIDFWSGFLHSAVEIVSDALHKLHASISRNVLTNCRVLAIALLLAALPPFLIYRLFVNYNYNIPMGLLIFSISIFFVTIEALRSIVIYALLAYDTFVRSVESLDEWLLGIHLTTGAIDLLIALAAIGYSLFAMASDGWSPLILLIVCTNFYYQVFVPIQSAWNAFQQRRETSKLLDSFAQVSIGELLEKRELCAICQQSVFDDSGVSGTERADERAQIVPNVKRTPCGHYFHISTLDHLGIHAELSPEPHNPHLGWAMKVNSPTTVL